MQKISVLFVCTGNICRSPTAEGVFRHITEQEGFSEHITIDSAGTGSWHSGSQPDERTQETAKSRGFDLSNLRARKLTTADLEKFDYLIAMDRSHLKTISGSAKKNKCHLLLEFSEKYFNQDALKT